ncbi:Alpha-2-macroglobulin N-terminal domain family protein [Oceaniovalibus guishaninsula JLT2003]|uniref:Alpha-2-macroglobulin N-terminal domain family protein n=1 Tax=Oceaniovalibus guishaninsula JLT2003 TaxID=1231392 RepID=K2I7J2_9RHOB|nr:alpha-2-macroglobulin family protein [Oceaniovalibus guishaninsula]EKE44985.1 Alpha-2-macroglobulin N-terminal domain family protein [Oceaniovalibus guishaninsula JLT2003]
MIRPLLTALALCLTAAPAIADSLADPAIPERRVTLSADTDFFGADLSQFFDTDAEACRAACLADPQCRAFTFNTRSAACFTKSEIRDRAFYAEALSGEIADRTPDDLARAAARADALAFLDPRDLQAARREAEALPQRHPRTGPPAVELLQSARAAGMAGQPGTALRLTGEALGIADTAALWTDYARLALDLPEDDYDRRRTLREQALAAAINAFLRAADTHQQVAALQIMADALERLDRGRDTIPALRLAQSIAPDADLSARLDSAIGQFGFRIVDDTVTSDAADPRICAEFSEPLFQAGQDYAPFIGTDIAGAGLEVTDRELCLSGVTHGSRYRVTFRQGLPAASGEVLANSVTLNAYIRDRAPSVRFPGNGYVLPMGADAALPVVTVNLGRIDLTLYRISDRNVIRAMQEDLFARPVPQWQQQQFRDDIAQVVWTGTGIVDDALNRDVTTRLPLAPELGDLAAGVYALQAAVPDSDPYVTPAATQWFVVSDLGLVTLEGSDGLHVFVRSLADAGALPGVTLQLVSRANAVLDTRETDADGHALFDAGTLRANGAAEPALVVARQGDDLALLPLTGPEFDLSDRGVEGRAPAGPIDTFLATDRGVYRAGETIHATVLMRDADASAIPGLPATAVLTRPDGVEYARVVSTDGRAGGHVFGLTTAPDIPRGTWRLDIFADPGAPALAGTDLLVEDFVPERIDVDLTLPAGPLAPRDRPVLEIAARHLFGGPAADLPVEAELRTSPVRTLDAWPGYVFGRHDAAADGRTDPLGAARTDAQGRLTLDFALPRDLPAGQPAEALAIVRVAEGSGRPVERTLTRALLPEGPMIGIRPGFDGTLPENADATFRVVGVRTDAPLAARWTLAKVRTDYQWYAMDGDWMWDPVTTRNRVDGGELVVGGDPVDLTVPVEWGAYELRIESADGAHIATSLTFTAGWYAPAGLTQTPDMLEVSLDADRYRPGDVARLRLVPRHAGQALIAVMSDRLIDMRAVAVAEGANTVDLPVTDDWGAGVYVGVIALRPSGDAFGPARALGLDHAAIDPGAALLQPRIDAPATMRPGTPLRAVLRVPGGGGATYATIAAVDLGVLNLTGFQAPDPSGWYFGQRRLGVGIRDLYGRLIDGRSGAMGQLRSGGDAAGGMRLAGPPPDDVVAFFEGPVQIGPDGTAEVAFDIPAFDGTLRLMAVVWSDTGIGAAQTDVVVRDPVVARLTLPRHLAPGDTSRLLVELTHAEGPGGTVGLAAETTGLTLLQPLPASVTLDQGETLRLDLPVAAGNPGTGSVTLTLTAPDGSRIERQASVPVRSNDPEIHRTSRFDLAPGDTFTFSDDVFDGLRDGTATLAAGPLAALDVPGLLAMLDRYPYGCTEQVASAALPLLYLPQIARDLGLADRGSLDDRVMDAVRQVLLRQTPSGGFGLWQPGDGDFWLDAYLTDFLSRARAEGIAVPPVAFAQALDNLRNQVAYAPDFQDGGEAIAYALQVLAREGAATMGDLRYYADVKAADLATPLALAQLGAALASYGDPVRADKLFRMAVDRMDRPAPDDAVWRSDYGTSLRDRAGVLALAAEAGSDAIDRPALAASLATDARLSTQEAVWTLLAANALRADATGNLAVDGVPLDGPLTRDAGTAPPMQVRNTGTSNATLTLTTFGVPEQPLDAGGEGMAIERTWFDLDGNPVEPDSVAAGTRLVALLTVQPFGRIESRLIVDDPLPAGFEIDNPNLLRSGDVRSLDWLDALDDVRMTEFRADRFIAAVDWTSDAAFRLAYIVRAVSPGTYRRPAASVEDMYRPRLRAHTATGEVTVTP